MGILADLFIATLDEARAYEAAQSNRPALIAKYQPAEYKQLTFLEFGTLWAILADEPWDLDKHGLETIYLQDEGESWLYRFPDGLVSLLAGLTDERLEQAVAAWAQTEELESWSAAELRPVVADLRRLARHSSQTGKGQFLWGSL